MAGLAVLHQTTRSSSAAGGAAVDQTQDNTSSEVIVEEAGSVMLKAMAFSAHFHILGSHKSQTVRTFCNKTTRKDIF